MSGVIETLQSMLSDGAVVDIDVHFARLMTRMDPGGGVPLAVAAALVSAASLRGDIGIGRDALIAACARWGDDGQAMVDVLDASAVCGDGDALAPLVRDRGRYYLYRYRDYENRLATALRRRNVDAADAPSPAALRPLLERLFEASTNDEVDWQRVAVALAMQRRLAIVSGGPGTGKTTTMVKLLAAAVAALGAGTRIALAAPTGKAAARMQQAVESARDSLNLEAGVRECIAAEASTLHRLLGVRRDGGFRHDADHPLPLDLLVVDEVSMVDLALMTRLVEAVPADARLVLLGDRDQLASVEPGSVFADLCRDAGGVDGGLASILSEATGQPVTKREGDVLPGASVELVRSFRFGGDSGIGRLSAGVKQGDVGRVFDLLAGSGTGDVQWREPGPVSPVAELASRFLEMVEAAAGDGTPEHVFAAYRRLQVLCAVRGGSLGVDRVNVHVERLLADAGLSRPDDPWYPGRPLVISANDYSLDLFNGDVGIVMPRGPRGEARACFLADGREPRWIHPARLPRHESAWAMTVHKSQGSEFDEVVLVLPDRDSPILTRELLYTAVSRARRRVMIHGSRAVIATAVARRVERQSALAERLADDPALPAYQAPNT